MLKAEYEMLKEEIEILSADIEETTKSWVLTLSALHARFTEEILEEENDEE